MQGYRLFILGEAEIVASKTKEPSALPRQKSLLFI